MTAVKPYPMVLVGGDGGELGLGEHKSLEVLLGVGQLATWRYVDHVQAGLVAVHRVKDHLRKSSMEIVIVLGMRSGDLM